MVINPDTFGVQMAAAGLAGLPVQWTADGLTYFGDLSDADRQRVAAVLAAHDPTKPAPRSATAKQVRYALNDLGVRQSWNANVMASPQADQDYWTSADPMSEGNPKIAKWCKAAGITPKALFDQATAE